MEANIEISRSTLLYSNFGKVVGPAFLSLGLHILSRKL